MEEDKALENDKWGLLGGVIAFSTSDSSNLTASGRKWQRREWKINIVAEEFQ